MNYRKIAKSHPGLTAEEAALSRRLRGSNEIKRRRRKSFVSRVISNLGDPVIRILLAALIINIIVRWGGQDLAENIGIAASVILATLISSFSESSSEAAFEKMRRAGESEVCRVMRDGQAVSLPIEEIVVGDTVIIAQGEAIPADGRIIMGSLTVDQSPLTGESRDVKKYPGAAELPQTGRDSRNPENPAALLRGCVVLSGEGIMEIDRTGGDTLYGEISCELQQDTRDSPLKLRLSRLARTISRIGYITAALVALAYLFNCFVIDSGYRLPLILMKLRDLGFVSGHLLGALTLAITIIVVAVPEGLPMMIAVVLSANIRRMLRDNVLVRKLAGIEAAGSMNLLFTDKTGTLTEGRMSVGELVCGDEQIKSYAELLRRPRLHGLFALSALVNTGSSRGEGGSVTGGNATDRALLGYIPADCDTPRGYSVLSRAAFDSARKYSAVNLAGRERISLIKGAPELLLPYVSSYICKSGEAVPLNECGSVARRIDELTADASRVILITYAAGEITADGISAGGRFPPLTLICAAALRDRVRSEAPGAVAELRGAGIGVVMITGDAPGTARAVAEKCGIIDPPRAAAGEGKNGVADGGKKIIANAVNKKTAGRDLCLSSSDLARMSDGELAEAIPRLAVIARALPSDKSRLIRAAQDAGLVAGMTGDGINDAPALKRADIGFAMGSGTAVAREAGDIIILDDRLNSISGAVLYGRAIFKSIRKFITLQLTMNFCAVLISMLGPLIGIDTPVTVVQMLWINIIMDTLGGLAFAGEPALPSYMNEPPKGRDEPILNSYMINQIVFLGSITVGLFIFFLKSDGIRAAYRSSPDNIYHMTAFFALFIFASILNCFNARSDRLRMFSGIKRNPAFITIMASITLIQIAFIYFGGTLLRSSPLLPGELLRALIPALLVIPADFIRKFLFRFFGKGGGY